MNVFPHISRDNENNKIKENEMTIKISSILFTVEANFARFKSAAT